MVYRAIYHSCLCGKAQQVWGGVVHTDREPKLGIFLHHLEHLTEAGDDLLEYAAISSQLTPQ